MDLYAAIKFIGVFENCFHLNGIPNYEKCLKNPLKNNQMEMFVVEILRKTSRVASSTETEFE